MKFNQKLQNVKQSYSEKRPIIVMIISMLLMGSIFSYFTDYHLIAGNIGQWYAVLTIIAEILTTVLFGINAGMLWHRIATIRRFAPEEYGATGTAATGSFFGLLVTGCPACSIGIASYFGFASFISSLPLFGLEVKVAAVGLLLYSTNALAKKNNMCNIKVEK